MRRNELRSILSSLNVMMQTRRYTSIHLDARFGREKGEWKRMSNMKQLLLREANSTLHPDPFKINNTNPRATRQSKRRNLSERKNTQTISKNTEKPKEGGEKDCDSTK
jgi:hypothetical protein